MWKGFGEEDGGVKGRKGGGLEPKDEIGVSGLTNTCA